MADNVYINIKDLPETQEVLNGDYLIVETPNGTNIIDFQNFILPSQNTLITATVSENTTAILNLSSDLTSTNQTLTELVSSFNTTNQQFQIGYCQISIGAGNNQSSNILKTFNGNDFAPNTFTVANIVITPANQYAGQNSAFVLNVDNNNLVTIQGVFPTWTLKQKSNPLTNALGLDPNTTSVKLSSITNTDYAKSLQFDVNTLITNSLYIDVDYTGSATNNAVYNVFAIKQIE